MRPFPAVRPLPALLGLLALLPLPAALAAPPAPRDAFALMARALRARLHQTYRGCQEIWFTAGTGTGWTRVVVDVARDGTRSRMDYRYPASVADLTVADDGAFQRQFQPACRRYVKRRVLSSEEATGDEVLSLLRRNYQCALRGIRRINGRTCELLALTPRLPPGPARLCWVDRATDTILRTEEYDAQGRRQYISAFLTLKFTQPLPDSLFSPAPPAGIVLQDAPPSPPDLPYPQARTASGVDGLAPGWAPPGYRLLRCSSLPRPCGARALLLRYGDGLKTLSVYEEGRTAALPPLALQQRMLGDQLGRYGQRAWVCDLGGLRVTAVGDATLPDGLGPDLMHALSPDSVSRLARALAHDFGPAAAAEARNWRGLGWGYDEIAARLLPGSDADRRERQARAWVSAALLK